MLRARINCCMKTRQTHSIKLLSFSYNFYIGLHVHRTTNQDDETKVRFSSDLTCESSLSYEADNANILVFIKS